MKLAIGGAALAAALMLGASPAAAQKPDQDALCFVAVSAFFGQISSQRLDLPAEMIEQVKVSMGFYAGRLTQRFPGPRLAPALAAARPAAFAMPADQQRDLLSNCIASFQAEIRTVVEATKEK